MCNLWSLISSPTQLPRFWKLLGMRAGASLFWLPMWFDTLWGDPISKFLLCTFADNSNSFFWTYTKSSTTSWSRRKWRRRRVWAWWSKQRWCPKAYLNTFINLLQYGLVTKWLSLEWYYNLYVLVLLILQINWGFGCPQPHIYLSILNVGSRQMQFFSSHARIQI